MSNPDARDPRTNTTDLDLDGASAGVVVPVCERLQQRSYLKGAHLHSVMLDMVALRANGANEAELQAYGLALLDLARTLCSERPICRQVSARMLVDHDIAEDHLRQVIAIDGENASTLEAHAKLLRRQGATSFAHADAQEREARRIRSGRTVSRGLLGLENAG